MKIIKIEALEKAIGSKAWAHFIVRIIKAAKELRRNLTSEETRSAMLKHQKAGRRMSDRTPYGTMKDPKDPARLVPNDYEQKVIKRILVLHKAGTGPRAIARQLHEEGFTPRKVKRKVAGGEHKWQDGHWHHPLILTIIDRAGGN
jgi:DNA invertase Pin-like site-specific DNA recombinase